MRLPLTTPSPSQLNVDCGTGAICGQGEVEMKPAQRNVSANSAAVVAWEESKCNVVAAVGRRPVAAGCKQHRRSSGLVAQLVRAAAVLRVYGMQYMDNVYRTSRVQPAPRPKPASSTIASSSGGAPLMQRALLRRAWSRAGRRAPSFNGNSDISPLRCSSTCSFGCWRNTGRGRVRRMRRNVREWYTSMYIVKVNA